MWSVKYGEFYFVGNLGISLQKLHMKFIFESNFYNFEHWKIELGIDWLLQHFQFKKIWTVNFYKTMWFKLGFYNLGKLLWKQFFHRFFEIFL